MLPAAFRQPLVLAGAILASAMAALFLIFLLLDVSGYIHSPYFGLLLFVAIPGAFLAGLLIIPMGLWLESRRRRRSPHSPPPDWPVFDLRVPRQRQVIGAVAALTLANVVLLSVASFGAVHHMETAAFCGRVCHTTMEPQFVAHQTGPHARVPCVDCHVGPGAEALVQSKLAGTRQLWHVMTRNVPTPIPSPIHNLRPARDTCEQCHWPEKFHGKKVKAIVEYGDDEKSTEVLTTLTLKVGGGSAKLGIGSGIHWHMNLDNEIEYVTTDPKREQIPWVRLRDRNGAVLEYIVDGITPEQLAAGERRRMDCLDCHNRPAHTFSPTAERAVNEAIAQGRIPKELPFARREAVAAVKREYPDRPAALEAIAAKLREHYRAYPSVDGALIERAIAGTRDVWARNVFPAMKVTWGTYPSQIGHIDAPGCFRCHDDNHKAKNGRVIRQDCEICHDIS